MNFFPPHTLELTLALFKPPLVKFPHAVQHIREEILNHGFFVVKSKRCVLSNQQVKDFYKEHEGKGFYIRLITFMLSGPTDAYVLAREDAIKTWRFLMGPTRASQAQFSDPYCIRGRFGLSDTRNATHGSDSKDSFEKESGIVFPDFNPEKWFCEEEIHFRNGFARFDEEKFIHVWSEDSPLHTPKKGNAE